MINDIQNHYDLLILEGNDPVLDPPELQKHMDKWDGQIFIDLLGLSKTKSALEVGCGTGRLAVRIAPFVKSFYGIDISPKTIETAKTHLPYDNTTLICADFLTHKFDMTFDIIYSSLTFMHIENKENAIKIVSNLLGDNGRFVLSIDKNQSEIIDYSTRKIKVYPDNPESLISLLEKNDFIEIEKYETDFAYILAANK